MCGRYLMISPIALLIAVFKIAQRLNLEARYNVAPTQQVPIVRLNAKGERELVMVRWGLVPFWAKDLAIGNRAINARAEGIETKPMFRDAIRRRRCLVPADGFYEWRKLPDGKTKQPMLIRQRSGEPFAFAGLWESWDGPDGVVETDTIITTTANATLAPIHERMPVILDPADYDRWLDPDNPRPTELLEPAPDDLLVTIPIGTAVNNVRNQGPELIEPIERQASLFDDGAERNPA